VKITGDGIARAQAPATCGLCPALLVLSYAARHPQADHPELQGADPAISFVAHWLANLGTKTMIFEAARDEIARRWEKARREGHSLQFPLGDRPSRMLCAHLQVHIPRIPFGERFGDGQRIPKWLLAMLAIFWRQQ